MSGVKIIDVSSNNTRIMWRTARLLGRVAGVFVKVTEGATYVSPTWLSQAQGAHQAGIPVGFYHYGRPDHNDPTSEAVHFCKTIEPHGLDRGKVALDLEVMHANAKSWIHEFNAVVRDQLGCWPMFYSYTDFIRRLGLSNPVGNGLWLADYGLNDGKRHPVAPPAPWKHVAIHQYTSVGKVAGVPGAVDVSWAASLTPFLLPRAV